MRADNLSPQESPSPLPQKKYSLRDNKLIKTLASVDALALVRTVLAGAGLMVLTVSILVFVFYIYTATKSNEMNLSIQQPTINRALLQQVHKELNRRQQILQTPPDHSYPDPFK